jgi:hypothetical protein
MTGPFGHIRTLPVQPNRVLSRARRVTRRGTPPRRARPEPPLPSALGG